MVASYRRINYSLRPAKTVERKMLCEMFQRLHPFTRVDRYRYIGFGSIYFSDFHLFHRLLGITDMLSIERDAYVEECFAFNCPYQCIRLDFRSSSEVLPGLDWSLPSIVWLDYDGKLDVSVLSDIITFCKSATSGSILLISVNVKPDSRPDDQEQKQWEMDRGKEFDIDEYRLSKFQDLVGENLPYGLTGAALRGDKVSQVVRKIMKEKIDEVIATRNQLVESASHIKFDQLIHINYDDGARMLTFGGILFSENQRELRDACAFDSIDFVRKDDEPYEIKVPCLTSKEMRHLNANLPTVSTASIPLAWLSPTDIANYAKIYRYFPTFAEATFA
ncbi:MAG: O-methyltransferase [Candidatus Accumulibacter sp. UW20]|jgi:hypothetical protein